MCLAEASVIREFYLFLSLDASWAFLAIELADLVLHRSIQPQRCARSVPESGNNLAQDDALAEQLMRLSRQVIMNKTKSQDKLSIEPSKSPDAVSLASNSTIRDFQSSKRPSERIYTVTIHESPFVRDDVLLNFDLVGGGAIQPGTLMSVTCIKPETDRSDRLQGSVYSSSRPPLHARTPTAADSRSSDDSARRYVFVAKDMPKDLKARIPTVEIYVAKHVGDAFNLRKGAQVILIPVDNSSPAIEASHVELSFKDMYLSRSDMWKLAVADLAERTVYKGQVIYFLGTIKATVTTVFVAGRKVQSAFFGRQTHPIFRSESARYMLFIQMAREMWEFDSDGSGEIMFYKVVNGFLPALFKKWAMLQVKHLVSIVLFSRVEYDTGLTTDLANTALHDNYYTGFQTSGSRRPYKDFYRVVVSEISSGEWTKILGQLKKEFNVFRRDINIHHREAMSSAMEIPEDPGTKGASISKIKAEPSAAMYGNFLEAIGLASSIYASDYIDRDLLRTGISIVLISPGPGVFEVEYESLRRTTEALVGNGIGIDLICIPNLPLHSVPLFRYRNPHFISASQRSQPLALPSHDNTPKQTTPLGSSYSTIYESLSPNKTTDALSRSEIAGSRSTDEWAFALPQWLHVSYWTGKSEEALAFHGATLSAVNHSLNSNSRDEFAIRCRLYDLQMRSVLETNEIETPYLNSDPSFSISMSKPHNEASHSRNRRGLDLFEPVYGFQKFTPEKLTKPGETSLWKQLQAFDESRSRLPPRNQTLVSSDYRELEEHTKKQLVDDTSLFGTSIGDKRTSGPPIMLSSSVASSKVESEGTQSSTISRRDSTTSTSQSKYSSAKAPKLMRHISLGHRGFGIAAPKAASAELKTEHVNAFQSSGTGIIKVPSTSSLSPMTPIQHASRRISGPYADSASPPTFDRRKTHLDEQNQAARPKTPTRPIQIRAPPSSTDPISTLKSGPIVPYSVARSAHRDDRDTKYSDVLREEDQKKLYNSKLRAGGVPELPSTLSPTTAMAPWLVVLNPSNPDASRVDDSVLFSRWQHVFPVPSEMKVMKWKSLSCPAAVPLTTEHFPSQSQFNAEYQRQPYNVSQEVDDDVGDEQPSRAELLQDLVSARFAHGFQVIVGPSVAKAFDQKAVRIADVFSIDKTVGDGTCIFMGIGNTIHQLSCVNGTEVEVNIFVRKPTEPLLQLGHTLSLYKPAIRTMFDKTYESIEIDIMTPKPERNWNYIDSYLAGHTDEMTENLRFWRARFVLIPMYPRTSSIPQVKNEDDVEEIRLEGIKNLAQIWQRHRHLSPEERQFQSVGTKKRDPNPLDIIYKTENASVVIAGEMETLPLFENAEGVHRKGLVSNKERFSKSNFNVAALAEAIQQPVDAGGIRMQTRRWHFRLHYHCFIGSDMTTWLLDNFEDLESREEAVELGNTLMIYEDDKSRDKDKDKDKETKDLKKERDRGIFVHVEKRHNFRDGQYFYQIASEYAKSHPQSWFNRKRDASVPATPALENVPAQSPRPFQPSAPRPGSFDGEESQTSCHTTPTIGPSNTAGIRRPKVVLSKMMKYDVDPRKKSFRPERINLHYDRLHNPDNCFHIRLEWMNVTTKLIDDALKTWAATASQHGLRLVEVPIAEVCRINEVNAFRRPYRVKLAIPPPTQRPSTYYNPGSFSPQPQPDKYFYQKAILKKLDYVLDYEAASNFPSNVEVSYSWGKPDFKYSQYIHRSGAHLVQITEDGDFLLAANRLYTNRVAATQPTQLQARAESSLSRPIVAGNAHTNRRAIDPPPVASPMTRPVLFAPSARINPPESSPLRNVSGSKPGWGPTTAFPKPEAFKDRLVEFCTDEHALETFYKETLEYGIETPFAAPTDSNVVPDASIPSLGLPPGILSAGGSDLFVTPTPRASTPSLASSLLFRRGSVQY
ncbi:hypothetical protein RRF57_004143 [Xylaria bambusicola]|uniref:Vacuolar membrane-associated protein IML1 n=1 Tax=Xylaria bambusicola TaxID=326684 RepID=A0AAN7UIU2_9PEZI